MATLTIRTATCERAAAFWARKGVRRLLRHLAELHQAAGTLLAEVEARDLPAEQVVVRLRDGGRWSSDGRYRSRAVDLVVVAPRDLLVQLVSCPEFRADWLDGLSLEEALAAIAG